MKDWPLNWRGDRGMMERICPHGIGHPDPDDVAFHLSRHPGDKDWYSVHGCDGCCTSPAKKAAAKLKKVREAMPMVTGFELTKQFEEASRNPIKSKGLKIKISKKKQS